MDVKNLDDLLYNFFLDMFKLSSTYFIDISVCGPFLQTYPSTLKHK